jgi:hypothetical protein
MFIAAASIVGYLFGVAAMGAYMIHGPEKLDWHDEDQGLGILLFSMFWPVVLVFWYGLFINGVKLGKRIGESHSKSIRKKGLEEKKLALEEKRVAKELAAYDAEVQNELEKL